MGRHRTTPLRNPNMKRWIGFSHTEPNKTGSGKLDPIYKTWLLVFNEYTAEKAKKQAIAVTLNKNNTEIELRSLTVVQGKIPRVPRLDFFSVTDSAVWF